MNRQITKARDPHLTDRVHSTWQDTAGISQVIHETSKMGAIGLTDNPTVDLVETILVSRTTARIFRVRNRENPAQCLRPRQLSPRMPQNLRKSMASLL
jgi:hypothetical protein